MTVIYGNCGDVDTEVLEYIWKGIPNVKVVNAFKEDRITIDEAIRTEKDILIFCGHGSSEGLFSRLGYALSAFNVELIKATNVIGVWCHAKDFAKKYHVHGFFTSMYISNRSEALFELPVTLTITNEEITESEIRFCKVLNNLIVNDIQDIKEWPKKILEILPPKNEVEKFNHTALEYVS